MYAGRRQSGIREALSLLLDAHEYSQDAQKEAWDFALEIDRLRQLGLNENEFRWLVSKGYVEHAVEMTMFGDEQRTFRQAGGWSFGDRSCFVLTANGVLLARSVPDASQESKAVAETQHFGYGWPDANRAIRIDETEGTLPAWDAERHELWLGSRLVKRFKRPSPNQEAVLAAFEEEHWPACVSDPLTLEPEIAPKSRLNNTIKALNRNQIRRLLHFKGDGSGEGIIWEPIDGRSHERRGWRPSAGFD